MDEASITEKDVGIGPPAKSGWRTTEFYVTLLMALMPVFTLSFGRELSSEEVQMWATGASGIASAVAAAVYSLSRARTKQASMAAATGRMMGPMQAPVGSGPAGQQAATPQTASPMAVVPIDTLATILARLDELTADRRAAIDGRTHVRHD